MTAIGSQESIQLAREAVEAFSTGDWERMRTTLAPDAVWEQVCTEDRLEGPDAIVELNRAWKQAFSDARDTVTDAFCADDTAVLEVSYQGTHDGDLQTPEVRSRRPADRRRYVRAGGPGGRRPDHRGPPVLRPADDPRTDRRRALGIASTPRRHRRPESRLCRRCLSGWWVPGSSVPGGPRPGPAGR